MMAMITNQAPPSCPPPARDRCSQASSPHGHVSIGPKPARLVSTVSTTSLTNIASLTPPSHQRCPLQPLLPLRYQKSSTSLISPVTIPINFGKRFYYGPVAVTTSRYNRLNYHQHGLALARRQRRLILLGYCDASFPSTREPTDFSIKPRGGATSVENENRTAPFYDTVFSRFFSRHFQRIPARLRNRFFHFHISHRSLIAMTLAVLCISLALSLWWSMAHGDVSGGVYHWELRRNGSRCAHRGRCIADWK